MHPAGRKEEEILASGEKCQVEQFCNLSNTKHLGNPPGAAANLLHSFKFNCQIHKAAT